MHADALGSAPFRVFCSYAHSDDRYRKRLIASLSPLRREGLITEWDDTQIDGGQEWQPAIQRQLDSADVILLLVSSAFLDSDFCYGNEMATALRRHEQGSALVIPILVRPTDWTRAPFSKLQVLPSGAKPLVEWKPVDRGYTDVAVGIRRALLRRNGSNTKEDGATGTLTGSPGPIGGGTIGSEAARARDAVPRPGLRNATLVGACAALVMLAGVVALVRPSLRGGGRPVVSTVPIPTTQPSMETVTTVVVTTVPTSTTRGRTPTTRDGPVVAAPSTTRPVVAQGQPTPPVAPTTTVAPSAGQWEGPPNVDLAGRCSATRPAGENVWWNVCVIGARGALVVYVSGGANRLVSVPRISTVLNDGFSPGRACPPTVITPGTRLVCYSEPRTYAPGEKVRGYGRMTHDGVGEENVYSPVVTL